ncbi:hypothetical protein [Aporhodopirellula aestuarii]|uniref:DUF4440 domain-containing protein n=1 Tax=Aporhodopirellula aestuarii TaxID=2950107 RepID=A0ABT0U9T3_9BACT|nr:hypothetical protein [Aporhodopirellula aestuarii]MCM2373577.1 hypothetical protein [Aporhodopirellula aestuarii]
MKTQILMALALALFTLTGIGCDSSGSVKPSDEQNAFASVAGLGDMAGDDESFAKAFVAGSVPKNRKDYSERGYEVAGEATFDGDTATVPVKIFGGVHATSGGEKRGGKPSAVSQTEQIWTLIRVDDKWKIKDAPLS